MSCHTSNLTRICPVTSGCHEPCLPSQFPQELVTYGGNGQVFSNWAQFWLAMNYLSVMEEDQTLVMYSGHPMGLFPSHPQAPRCVITNGMVRMSAED